MSTSGAFHLAFAVLAILFGGVVLVLPKGGRWHRTVGQGYFWSMVGVVATSFTMYRLTGEVTPFHFAAAISGLTIAGGMWTVLRRRPGHWVHAHALWMTWSYVGLIAALVAESLTRLAMPSLEATLERRALWPAFWILVATASGATFLVGAAMIRRYVPRAVRIYFDGARSSRR